MDLKKYEVFIHGDKTMSNIKLKFKRRPMTFYQQVIYDCIVKFMEENHCAPTFREIGKMANLSAVSTVHAHLQTLKRKGYINYEPGVSRSIRILEVEND